MNEHPISFLYLLKTRSLHFTLNFLFGHCVDSSHIPFHNFTLFTLFFGNMVLPALHNVILTVINVSEYGSPSLHCEWHLLPFFVELAMV